MNLPVGPLVEFCANKSVDIFAAIKLSDELIEKFSWNLYNLLDLHNKKEWFRIKLD
jgi:hypothetical protein